MATIQLQPPGPFSFSNSEEWPRWKARYEQFRIASGLSAESNARQVSTLLYCLGEETSDVLLSSGATDDDKSTHAKLIAKLDSFFLARRNVIYEGAKFNLRSQLPGETAEQFIIALYTLSETCAYGSMREELIRDRLVVGILDSALSEKMQLDSSLTLEKAKKEIRLKEAVRESQRDLRRAGDSKENPVLLDATWARPVNTRARREAESPASSPSRRSRGRFARNSDGSCARCGGRQHPIDACPAKDAICHRCQRRGHFRAQCFSKDVHFIHQSAGHPAYEPEDEVQVDTLERNYLGAVTQDTDSSAWTVEIRMGTKQVTFKLDTGAEVSAITEPTYCSLENT